MIPGYNHNVNYKNQIYHVQTEDSGVENPHIITHLFVGGNIIESRKTSYAEVVGSIDLQSRVVALMQAQHKAVLKSLIKGQLDHKLAVSSVGAAHLDGPAPLNVERGQSKASFGFATPMGGKAPASPASPPAAPKPPAMQPPPLPARPRVDTRSSFFGNAPPPEQIIEADVLERAFESKDESAVDSIFGEDLISEKSLDEVILSYLAEDMQK